MNTDKPKTQRSWSALGILLLVSTLAIGSAHAGDALLSIALDPEQPSNTGLGIAITWNSQAMRFRGIDSIYKQGLLAANPVVEYDQSDIDNNPQTDRLIRLAWIDINGNWNPHKKPLAALDFQTNNRKNLDNAYRISTISGSGYAVAEIVTDNTTPLGQPQFHVLELDRQAFAETESYSPAPKLIRADQTAVAAPLKNPFAVSRQLVATPESTPQLNCSPDFDESNAVDALTDGLLAIRHLFGFSGDALVADAVDANALIKSAASLSAEMAQPDCMTLLDIDGNGSADALTDGLLFIRWAFGFSGDALIADAIGSNATRTTAKQILDYLNSLPLLPEPTAARFLTQASFGPQAESIAELSALPGGIRSWIEQQFTLPVNLQLPAVKSLTAKMCKMPTRADTSFPSSHHQIWWEGVIEGQDQLRQRMAFALSQILVVSDHSPGVNRMQFGLSSYYDVLLRHAFGNYRDLLEEVTLHPVMGVYLSMVRNEKADPERNIRPDENYAREVMQLFSLGVYLLNPDGSLQLDNNGDPIPTYTQEDIEQFAKVFTGWNYAGLDRWNASYSDSDTSLPMESWEDYHDTSEKHLLNGVVIPAGGTAQSDLNAALDNLFNHPNIAPFISKQLIQRFVTSNPSPAYVGRVAAVFNDNGAGIKGDLKAVIKAILLDEEARAGHLTNPQFGKLREPLLRITHYWRAFNALPLPMSGAYLNKGTPCEGEAEPQNYNYYNINGGLYNLDNMIGQGVMQAPSVFNFYLPDFSPSGPVREQGLVAPEFQLATENYVVNSAELLNHEIQYTSSSKVNLDFTLETQLVEQSTDALLSHLDLLLLNGNMSDNLYQSLANHLNNSDFRGSNANLYRARDAIMLISVSPEYLIQR